MPDYLYVVNIKYLQFYENIWYINFFSWTIKQTLIYIFRSQNMIETHMSSLKE